MLNTIASRRTKKSLLIAAIVGFLPLGLMALVSTLGNLSETTVFGFFFGVILLLTSLFYSPVQVPMGFPREGPSDFVPAAILYFLITFGICYLISRKANKDS